MSKQDAQKARSSYRYGETLPPLTRADDDPFFAARIEFGSLHQSSS